MADKVVSYQDPSEKKIEDARKSGKVLDWTEFKDPKMQAALTRLNKMDESKNDTAAGMAKKQADSKAKPFIFHKGGTVKKSGMAMVKRGEKVLTKKQASKATRKRA
jgi:hypothetical protein